MTECHIVDDFMYTADIKYVKYKRPGIEVAYCHNHGFVHVVPYPSQEEINKYYSTDQFYATHSPNNWFVKEQKEHDKGYWSAYYAFLASKLVPNLPLWDLGSGTGYFVKHWVDNTRNFAFGIEPSEVARSMSPIKDRLKETLAEGITDVNVSAMLVLEHVANPKEFLQTISDMIAHEGRAIVVVPNDFSKIQKRIGTHHFVQKVHINYFQPKTLRNLCHEVFGKAPIYEGATFPMELFQVLGYKYIGRESRGKNLHNFRLKLEKLFGKNIFKLYKFLFDRWELGREIIFVVENA